MSNRHEGSSHTPQPPSNASPLTCKRLIPLLVLVVGLVAFFALGLHRYSSFQTLRAHRDALLTWVHTTGVLAAVTYMAVYAVAVAFSLPGGAVLSIAGGFLFVSVLFMAGATPFHPAARHASTDLNCLRSFSGTT